MTYTKNYMSNLSLFVLAFLGVSIFTPALAQTTNFDSNKLYVGLGYMKTSSDSTSQGNYNFTTEADGYGALLGYRFTDNISAELEYADVDYDITVNGVSNVLSASANAISLSTLFYANFDSVRPFITLGYTEGDYTVKEGNISIDVEQADFGYGAGVDFDISDNFSLRARYTTCSDCLDTVFLGGLYTF